MNAKNLLNILACPDCRTRLNQKNEFQLECESCKQVFEIRENIPILLTKEFDRSPSSQDKKFELEFMKQAVQNDAVKGFDRGVYAGLKEQEYRDLFDKVLIPSGDEERLILDLGCGVGLSSIILSKYGYEVAGLDIIFEGLRKTKTIVEPGEILPFLVVGDVEHTPFLNQIFDAIFVGGVFHHFPNYVMALEECYRILKTKGRLIALEPNWLDLPSMLKFTLGRQKGYASINESALNPFKFKKDVEKYFHDVQLIYPGINHTRYIINDTVKKKISAFFRNSFYTIFPEMCSNQFFLVIGTK
ncbi:MAG: class I SAM-dependent methyltransferase [Dehalococcoidia bacterium]|nr:class I SAM-dependent methyltransferase [Dehalococcoidia bacterium]